MEWKKKKNIRFELLGPQCKAPNYWRQNQSPFDNGSQANSHLSKLQTINLNLNKKRIELGAEDTRNFEIWLAGLRLSTCASTCGVVQQG